MRLLASEDDVKVASPFERGPERDGYAVDIVRRAGYRLRPDCG